MYDDEPYLEPVGSNDPDDVEIIQPRSRGNCLFVVTSIVLIISLACSSILTFYLTTGRTGQASDRNEPLRSGPTAAPATVVAAVPTLLPTIDTNRAASAPQINRIAIINSDGQIETMSPTGQDRRALTLRTDNTLFQFPAWAPDGRRLAVVGSRSVGGGIYVLEDAARTGALGDRQVYFSADNTPFYLYWSPDSQNLAFLANHSRSTMGLNVVAGDGTDDSRLLATGAPFYWDWSNDSRQLLIHSGRTRSNNTLALIDLEGTTQAGNLAIPGDFQAPGIGKDGRYWAFAEQTADGLSALAIVDTQSGERRSYEQAGSLALSWSPEKDLVAFTNGTLNGHPYWGPLRLLDVATGEVRTLSTQTVLAFFWSPDGRSIAFITLSRDDNDESINANQINKPRRVSRMEFSSAQPFNQGMLTLSVLDIDTGTGLRLLEFQPTAVFLTQFLPFFDQYALSHRIWSPDSTAIVLPVREEDGNMVVVVTIEGGQPHRLAEGEIAFWSQK